MRPALLKTFSPEMFLASLCLHPPFVFHLTSILPNPSLPTLPGHPPVQGILQQSNNAHQGFGLEQCCCSWRCAPYNLVPGKPKPLVTLGIPGFDGKSVYCRSSSHIQWGQGLAHQLALTLPLWAALELSGCPHCSLVCLGRAGGITPVSSSIRKKITAVKCLRFVPLNFRCLLEESKRVFFALWSCAPSGLGS